MTFHEERQLNCMTLQAGKMKFFDFMTFQVFCDLYKPRGYFSLTCISAFNLIAHDWVAHEKTSQVFTSG